MEDDATDVRPIQAAIRTAERPRIPEALGIVKHYILTHPYLFSAVLHSEIEYQQ
jgi:hypothetical protein